MDHQDFKPIVFNSNEKKEIKESQKEILKKISQKQVCTNDNEKTRTIIIPRAFSKKF